MSNYEKDAIEAVKAINIESIARVNQITAHTIDYIIAVFGADLADCPALFTLAVNPFLREFIERVRDCGTFADLPDNVVDDVLAKSWQGYNGMLQAFKSAGVTP